MSALVKARLAEIGSGERPTETPNTSVDVQFNPTTLRVQISNRTAGGTQAGAQARPRPGTGEMQVSFDLIFDTADEGSSEAGVSVLDRTATVERFVRPRGPRPGQEAPPRVLFEWRSFLVQVTMESANIDLDLSDANGVPLRAKVSVSIKGQDPRWTYTPAPANAAAAPGSSPARPAAGSALPAGSPGTQGNSQSPGRIAPAAPGVKHIFLVFMILCSNFAIAEDKAIAAIFSAEGVDGTIILKSLRGDKTITHNDARASRRFASASTFKIFNTLIAVQENVVSVAGTAFRWDGKTHDFPDWNRDQTLESAFKVSCVWCYQEIAKQVGEETYRRYLALAKYGALSKVADSTTLWLDGSFTVSAVEQVALLKKIYLRELPFRDDAYDALKGVMLAEQTESYKLYAKTGWAARMNPQIGWYVG